jgi:Fe-S cluster assembly protein SufD
MSIPLQDYQDTFQRAQQHLPGAKVAWLARMRDSALATLQQRGLPDTHVEAWKYTDLRSLGRHTFKPADGYAAVTEADLKPWLFEQEPMHRLVFIDGRLAPQLFPLQTLPNGVTLTSLARVLEQNPDELEHLLGRTLDPERPGFDAMNTAFLQDGVCLKLERGAVLDQPLHLLFINTGQAERMTTVRNVIMAGPGSSASVIESWLALGDATSLSNTVTEIQLADNASLQHYKLEQEGGSATHIGSTRVRQQRDSRFISHSIALGGRLVRNELDISLVGRGAECTLNGLSITRDRQHVDNHTRIEHRQPQASSIEHYRSILDDRSRAVFSGRIVVHPGAQKTCAEQSNHSLLLSPQAEADARPQFEIYADDVQCTHGCTVGELDAEALFYLRSRALDSETARKLLVYAFAADVLERMQLEPVRHYLEQQLAARLTGNDALLREASRH